MKPRCSPRRNHALTLFEVLVVIAVLMILTAVLLPPLSPSGRKARRISCVNNLKEMDLAARIWEGNHGDQYPMAVSTTNGGAMEFAMAGNATIVFQVMSNELSTPRILFCPADADHSPATNFSTGFSTKNISYFINLNATEANPQMMFFGDDNFEISGVPVNPGLLQVPANASITWSAARHSFAGNIALTDGSVMQLSAKSLLEYTALATNRLAIP